MDRNLIRTIVIFSCALVMMLGLSTMAYAFIEKDLFFDVALADTPTYTTSSGILLAGGRGGGAVVIVTPGEGSGDEEGGGDIEDDVGGEGGTQIADGDLNPNAPEDEEGDDEGIEEAPAPDSGVPDAGALNDSDNRGDTTGTGLSPDTSSDDKGRPDEHRDDAEDTLDDLEDIQDNYKDDLRDIMEQLAELGLDLEDLNLDDMINDDVR